MLQRHHEVRPGRSQPRQLIQESDLLSLFPDAFQIGDQVLKGLKPVAGYVLIVSGGVPLQSDVKVGELLPGIGLAG